MRYCIPPCAGSARVPWGAGNDAPPSTPSVEVKGGSSYKAKVVEVPRSFTQVKVVIAQGNITFKKVVITQNAPFLSGANCFYIWLCP